MKYTPFQKYLLKEIRSQGGVEDLPRYIARPEPETSDWWHPPMLPPDLTDADALGSDAFEQTIDAFVEWMFENFDSPLVEMLLRLFGLDLDDLDAVQDLNFQDLVYWIMFVIRNWGDPDVGDRLPDFPFRAQVISGHGLLNPGSWDKPGYGGLYGTIHELLQQFADGLEGGTIYGDDQLTQGWLLQWVQSLLDMINEAESGG